tara:strand:- start:1560 stop:1688 length:129 start_codon:yes stop_codon:yes gene_type:complete
MKKKLLDLVEAFVLMFVVMFGLTFAIYGGWTLATEVIDMIKG